MTKPFSLPQTIDEVLVRMEEILKECKVSNNRAGYFAALYYTVTKRIKLGIEKGEFEDNKRMERLDIIFANRYLEAWYTWKQGGKPSACWLTAFEASKNYSPVILQHLLLGMNAHINLDLGLATVTSMKDQDIEAIHRDFNHINTILASMVYKVINQLNQVSPLLSLLGFHATNTNIMLTQFTIEQARDGAWVFAEELHGLAPEKTEAFVTKRDQRINELAVNIAYPKGLARITMLVIRLFERTKPATIIGLLER